MLCFIFSASFCRNAYLLLQILFFIYEENIRHLLPFRTIDMTWQFSTLFLFSNELFLFLLSGNFPRIQADFIYSASTVSILTNFATSLHNYLKLFNIHQKLFSVLRQETCIFPTFLEFVPEFSFVRRSYHHLHYLYSDYFSHHKLLFLVCFVPFQMLVSPGKTLKKFWIKLFIV